MDNLRINMFANHIIGYLNIDNPDIRIAPASQKTGVLGDSAEISSIAKRLAQEISDSKLEMKPDSVQGASPQIDPDYVNSLIELGKSVPKGDNSIDDLSWGLTVSLGMEMGIEDADVLRELKLSDVDTYFYEAAYKRNGLESGMKRFDENGEAVVYDNPAEIWKDMFKTDADGNFLKDNHGNAVRNEDFTQWRVKPQTPAVTIDSIQGDVWEFRDYDGRIADASAGFLQNLLLGVSNNDPFMYRNTREQATNRMPVWSSETTSGMTESDRLNYYTKQLAYSYSLLKSSMTHAPTVEEQMEAIRSIMRGGEWSKVRSGGGISDYLTGRRG